MRGKAQGVGRSFQVRQPQTTSCISKAIDSRPFDLKSTQPGPLRLQRVRLAGRGRWLLPRSALHLTLSRLGYWILRGGKNQYWIA
jgi:hypothetical protein